MSAIAAASDRDAAGWIRTPDQRLRVFISSTMTELAAERAAARAAVERLRLTPVLFELSARPHPPRALYQAYLDQSQVFVGVYWQRYGSLAPGLEISGLEDEYLLSGDKPRLIYVKQPAAEIEPRLVEFLRRIEDDALTSHRSFATAAELEELLTNDLALLLSEGFGWADGTERGERPDVQRLPMPLTRLIGRERELDELCSLVSDPSIRLLTMTGAGGTGKSRLAIEAGRRLATRFPGGAVFVDVAPINAPELFAGRVAEALAIVSEGRRPAIDAVVEHLRRRPALLVVDNFEQVVDAGPVLGSLLEECPDARALVTSRVRLSVRGEREYQVLPLPTPAARAPRLADIAGSAAAQLFLERAADAAPGFGLTAENADAVAEICRRLDGLPLALELAAAHVRVLGPSALLERLSGRLDLGARRADLPERQRTLRATLDWSYGLLDESERAMFARLAIFTRGWTLAAAEALYDDDERPGLIDALASLVEKSLVAVDALTGCAEPRFRMLETVREYATERLAERDDCNEVARRHASYFAVLCEHAEPHLTERAAPVWFERLDADVENLRASSQWALAHGEHELLARAWAATFIYWWTRDQLAETRPLLEQIVPLPPTVPAKTRADAAWMLGACRLLAGERQRVRGLLEESLALAREAGDAQGSALALSMLGAIAPRTGGADGAWALHREALALARAIGWRWGIAYILHHLGDTAIRDRNAAAVIAYDTECLRVARELENEPMEGMALWQLGWAHLLEGDHRRARAALVESAAICRRLGSTENMSYCLDGFAGVALAKGDAALAARCAGAADAARERLRVAPFPPLVQLIDEGRSATRAALGENAFATEHDAGAAMTPEDALAVVVANEAGDAAVSNRSSSNPTVADSRTSRSTRLDAARSTPRRGRAAARWSSTG